MRPQRMLILAALLPLTVPALATTADWPSYNRTLTSERFSSLAQIDSRNAGSLKIVCTYDTKEMVSFQSGLLQASGALFGTTERDTFSIDPDTCKENWRVHEDFIPGKLQVNRGAAILDGRIFRGTTDGRVLAYDASTGARLWETPIADAKAGESVPAAPIAWNGMVFIGNAGGDNKGVKGRMYALDAATGKIVWEFYMVPKSASDLARGPAGAAADADMAKTWKNADDTPISGGATWTSYTLDPDSGLLYVPGGNPAPDFVGALRPGDNLFSGSVVVLDARSGTYRKHFQLVPHDFHDWDVSSAPTVFTDESGKRVMAVASKDGHLYGYDLEADKRLYRSPVTTIANVEAALTPKGVRFCPGTQGGAEWNGAAYDPALGVIFTGTVDWCTTVRTDPLAKVQSVALGQPWSGAGEGFGKQDPVARWAGWLTATDATTGKKRWKFKAPFPLMSGVTPTAGGVVLFGDMGGHFHVLDSKTGNRLWMKDLGGAIGGGVITYDTGGGQKVAVAAGMTSPIWPTPKVTAKVVVLGLK